MQNIDHIKENEQEFKRRFGSENYDYSLESWALQEKAFRKKEIQVIKITASKLY